MERFLCDIIRFVGLGLIAALMIPAAMLISAIRFIFDISDSISEKIYRRNK
ncbi:hypothetical protein [Huintestinicola sp.]|uniref:hypothetical protein n=1 Tax=Huintestinicola sp. TaxID=2981661 RepID=UPI003D7C423B